MAQRAVAGLPIIFETLDQVRPDETLLLFGADVTPQVTAEGLRLPDSRVSEPPSTVSDDIHGKAQMLEVLQASDLSAKVLMPPSWKPGVYAVRLHNADGFGEWQIANRPQLWWTLTGDDDKAQPGGELRVFGKNFGKESRLWVRDAQGHTREIPVKVARDYDISATLPADLKAGQYSVWLHNGFGGEKGFGAPVSIEVVMPTPWPDTVFDVTKYGAKHDYEHDDTEAIRSALKAAEANGGGIVLLPNGTYIVTGKLVVPKRTILRGEKREGVWIKVPVYWPKPPQKLVELESVIAGNGEFGVENLSIVAQPARRIIAAPDLPPLYSPGMARLPGTLPNANAVHIRNVRIHHLYFGQRLNDSDRRRVISEGPSTIVVNGKDFSLEKSEIVSGGMPIQIQDATRAKIVSNILRTGRNGWYGLWNFSKGIFEGNDISGADLEGSYGGIQGNAVDLLFRDNHWHDAYGDEREALTFDTPYDPAWMGHVVVSGTTLTFQSTGKLTWPPPTNYPKDLFVVVAGGRGLGQAVPVSAVTENGVVLASPLKVVPNENSTIAIVARKSHVIIADNLAEDAGVAFQLYSQSHEFIIANNRATRTGGSYARGGDFIISDRRHYSYALFNQWRGNIFRDGLTYNQGYWPAGFLGIHVIRSAPGSEATPAVGDRFIDNIGDAGTRMGLSSEASSKTGQNQIPFGTDMLFESNLGFLQASEDMFAQGFRHTLQRRNRSDPEKSFQ